MSLLVKASKDLEEATFTLCHVFGGNLADEETTRLHNHTEGMEYRSGSMMFTGGEETTLEYIPNTMEINVVCTMGSIGMTKPKHQITWLISRALVSARRTQILRSSYSLCFMLRSHTLTLAFSLFRLRDLYPEGLG